MEMLKEAVAAAAEWRICTVDDDDRGTMEYILDVDDDGRFWFIMISR